jgi:hypothetical protein
MMLDWPNRAAPKPIDTFYNGALRLIIAAGELRPIVERNEFSKRFNWIVGLTCVSEVKAHSSIAATLLPALPDACPSPHAMLPASSRSSPAKILTAPLLPSLEESPAERFAFLPESRKLMQGD